MLGMNALRTATSIGAGGARRLTFPEGSRRMDREGSRTGLHGGGIETRTVERDGRLVEAVAPAHWTAARLDAWIDWAGGVTDIPTAVGDFVEDVTARAQAKGLVRDVRARTQFRDALTGALLAGVIAI